MFKTLRTAALLTAALSVGSLTASSAWACGGLFCNNGNPVNQAAERIVFVDHADDKVTAIVEILYDGPAEEFSWLVPVPGTPEVGLSSTFVLDDLQQRTNPTYTLRTRFDECDTSSDGVPVSAGPDFNDNNSVDEGGGVDIIASGSLGPYEYQVIEVNESAEDRAAIAVDWLESNGYDVAGPEILREYLDAGMNILGFKLNKTASTGSIRPVTMTYETTTPMIPIKLTAVAANDNMGVLTWVLSEHRALPSNYRNLILNEAALDWFNPNSNYNELVIRAADEAGGQGFVTEAADSPENLGIEIPSQVADTPTLHDLPEKDILLNALGFYQNWDGMDAVIQMTVPLPENVSASDFLDDWHNLLQTHPIYNREEDIEGFEPDTFVQMMEDMVIEPAKNTYNLLLSRPYMTRFYTTLSAAEMTLDPVFEYNADLPTVSNQHIAQQEIHCYPEPGERAWSVTLENGDVLGGEDFGIWPEFASNLPANRVVQQLSSTEDTETVTDNSSMIRSTLNTQSPDYPEREDGCACSSVSSPDRNATYPGIVIAMILGALWIRKRKPLP